MTDEYDEPSYDAGPPNMRDLTHFVLVDNKHVPVHISRQVLDKIAGGPSELSTTELVDLHGATLDRLAEKMIRWMPADADGCYTMTEEWLDS